MGTNYHGSQIQENANTIQQEFQNALMQLFGYLPSVKCCSRTDAGVHANRFCISFFLKKEMDANKLTIALNTKLPYDIRVLHCKNVPDDFHARYDCVEKRYIYKVWNSRIMNPFFYGRALQFVQPIDEAKLNEIAKVFLGTHDFESMSSVKRDVEDTVRTISEFSVTREGDLVTFSVTADGFLYNMVRIMVGTLLNASRNKLCAEDIKQTLTTGKRTNLCMTAPPEGLYLDDVIYDFSELK